jgi:Family of unknown function (DUF5681)
MGNEYSVGYGKPPIKHQFKKGKSGNPRGRRGKPRFAPNEPLDFERVVVAELQSSIMIGDGRKKKKKISQLEAIFKLLVALSLKADRSALKAVVALIEKLPKDAFRNEARRKRNEAIDQLLEEYGQYEIKSEDEAPRDNGASRSSSSAVADCGSR